MLSSRILPFDLCLVLCAGIGCNRPPVDVAALNSAIQGGVADPGDPAVVLLLVEKAGAATATLCSAEVVSKHVALTAAHCVDPATVGAGQTFRLFLGADLRTHTASDFVAVAETHFDTAFDPMNPQAGHDVAVLITATAINVPPLAMNHAPLGDGNRGAALRLVGYGITQASDTTGMTAGVRRQTTTTLSAVQPLFLEVNDAVHNTCEGDSGGPALLVLAGREVIAGITSYGDLVCATAGSDTRVDLYAANFVDPYIAAHDPPPPGTAAPGEVGSPCSAHSDCVSGVCAAAGQSSYCTASCDPTRPSSCPAGTQCGSIDNSPYCLRSAGSGGCSAEPNRPATGTAWLAGLAMLLLGRRRMRRTAINN